ncbi:MAG: transporter permease [Bacilli bacterium]|nr:transporter permease [Bacilli bacterium]
MLGKKKKVGSRTDNLTGYLFISPFIIGFLILTLFPMISTLYLSFTDYSMLGNPGWIGLANYQQMLTADDKYWHSVSVTFYYVCASVPVRLLSALIIAILLNQILGLAGLFRSVLYLPSVIGGSVAVSVMWKQLFGSTGAINSILTHLGIPAISWFGHPAAALWTLILLAGWQFGSPMLIFLSGLKNIPQEFYEAASVDGANAVQKFLKITLPLLTPIILFNLVMQIIQAFLAFTPSYIISNGVGGPLDGTLLYVLYMFRNAFEFFRMGYASAMAWMMLLLIGLFTALVFKSSSYWVHYETEGE